MTQKKEAGKASGEKQTGNSNKGKGTKKRTRIYPPERKYILVSKWHPSNNVLLLDRTKRGGRP